MHIFTFYNQQRNRLRSFAKTVETSQKRLQLYGGCRKRGDTEKVKWG